MLSLTLRGFALGVAIAATPGPIFFLCLRRTLTRGWVTGVISGLGVATADAIYGAVAAFGIAAVSAALVGQRRWLALIGGTALVMLGVRSLLLPAQQRAGQAGANDSALRLAYLSTLGLTMTNPATILSFVACSQHSAWGLEVDFCARRSLSAVCSLDRQPGGWR